MRALPLILALMAAPALAEGEHGHDHDHEEHAEGEHHDAHDDHGHEDHAGHDDHGHGDHAHEEHAGDDDGHLSEVEGVRILHAWTPATRRGPAPIYFEFENERDAPVMVTGGATDHGEAAAVMGVSLTAGGAPVTLGEMEILAGDDVDFDAQGVFLMLVEIDEPLEEGQSFPLDITVEPVGTIEVQVDVLAADATRHPHAGHVH
ncbi:copper chaperone PCu(A)C [Pontivivens ytuae]|uniref:Copper chaperone PCu(A)C n=1 Tax=Pontivivens ytuae TaxID=2789856 RepID=A0A7S9LT75_9RHOB|nr:copper chaperone PCu(A)C [Pontivivens ytuae]QPH54701.1 copper chaperone PCu(A)C [Pontivivens ytuae]